MGGSRVAHRAAVGGLVLLAGLAAGQRGAVAQEAPPVSAAQVAAAIDALGSLEYAARAGAAQVVRRAPAPLAVAALLKAVDEHRDGYVRFRAMVLLSGFSDPRTRDVMLRAIDDPNDRLREVGYAWLEDHPEAPLAPRLLKRLEREVAEFVRPALVRALAALGSDRAVQDALTQEAFRGQDFFRSTVIEALGEHRARYAVPALRQVATLDGPLRDDAVLALGRIGEPEALETVVALQRTVPREEQPIVAAALCLLGRNCEAHRRFLAETLSFGVKEVGFQGLVRAAATGLGALAQRGDPAAFHALVETGIASRDPARAPVALAAGRVAVRTPQLVLDNLSLVSDEAAAVLLLRDAFDMLEEDYDEERFYVAVRRAYWKAPEGSATRRVGNRLIAVLEF